MKYISGLGPKLARSYEAAAPKQFGSLHERMKYVMTLASKADLARTHHDLNVALHDLEAEVEHHQPADPPFGRRLVRPGKQP